MTHSSAYFTSLDLAYDFAYMSPIHSYVLDACTGIGILSHAALTRDTYDNDIKQIICIEKNIEIVKIGHKLAKYTSYILPAQHCTFCASRVAYPQDRSNRNFSRLKKDLNEPNLIQKWTSIDTSVYEGFKNTEITVECLNVEVDEV